jgi:hypothetical protein
MCTTLYSGVDQTTPWTWTTQIDSASNTNTLTVSAAAGSIVSSRFGVKGKASVTPGGGQTMRWQQFDPAYAVMVSDKAGATSVSSSYTYTAPAVESLLGVLVVQAVYVASTGNPAPYYSQLMT